MRKESTCLCPKSFWATITFLILCNLLWYGGPLSDGGVMAFSIPVTRSQRVPYSYGVTMPTVTRRSLSSSVSPEEDNKEEEESTPTVSSSIAANDDTPVVSSSIAMETKAEEQKEPPAYPLDVPSPILLASSMIIAIASTGSLFEIMGGTPQLGFAPTAAIVALGFPATLFLFYASIQKAIAETEEDDERFLSGK